MITDRTQLPIKETKDSYNKNIYKEISMKQCCENC